MSKFVPNELVWVKLGGVQWPAVVKDKAEAACEEFLEALKRDPIVVVEFFDKKLHDVHNKKQICRYNCEEKEDIMLKSLQLTKNKSDISENFKKDVITAEKLTDGDIHILSRDKFSTTGRLKYDELFGSGRKPTPKSNVKKKAPRPSEDSPKQKTSKYSDLFPDSASKSRRPTAKPKKPAKPAADSSRPNITHPRFIAENDHKIHILAPNSPEARTVAPSVSDPYRCSQCDFTTGRLNVLVLHNKAHVAAAAAKPAAAKRKNGAEAGDATPKKKKRPAGADGSTGKVSKTTKAGREDDTPKKSAKASPKKSAPGTPKKSPKKDRKTETEKPKTPFKLSPLKPAQSSRPQLLEDWDEDDDEEEAERAKIQSEIDRFICDKKTPKTGGASASRASTSAAASPAEAAAEAVSEDGIKTEEDVKEESVEVGSFTLSEPDSERLATTEGAETTADEAAADATEPPTTDGDAAAAVNRAQQNDALLQSQRERNDALLQSAVDDVLADTAPAALPTLPSPLPTLPSALPTLPSPLPTLPSPLPTLPSPPPAPAERVDPAALSSFDFTSEPEPEPVAPRPRTVRVCPAGSPPRRPANTGTEDVTSSRPTPTSSADALPTTATSTLPPNLQILSVPGTDGQPDTYVLVSVDEQGDVQTVNPLDNLGGLGADTLLAYEVAQEDGSTRTAYLNPASLSTSADIKQLLGADEKVDSTTPLPDSSGK